MKSNLELCDCSQNRGDGYLDREDRGGRSNGEGLPLTYHTVALNKFSLTNFYDVLRIMY
jgi:hypothetical protein